MENCTDMNVIVSVKFQYSFTRIYWFDIRIHSINGRYFTYEESLTSLSKHAAMLEVYLL